MNLTQRTIRIAISAVLSVLVATYLGLENPLSAGIIAILGVLDTRLETIQNALKMFLSLLLAFVVATIIFLVFDFSVFSFGIYLAFYVPLAYTLKVDVGIAPSSVLVTHFIIAGSISWPWQLNGILIMAIGLVFATIAHLWNPSYNQKLDRRIVEIERQMSLILFLLEKRLVAGNETTGRIKTELQDLYEMIHAFEDLAFVELENRQFSKNGQDYYIRYAQMRKQQYEILDLITNALANMLPNTEEKQNFGFDFRAYR